MDTDEIISYLEAQRDAVDHALQALGGSDGTRPKFRRGKRKLSAEARKRISQAQRKRWRKLKAKSKT